jgi:hypothetical protein
MPGGTIIKEITLVAEDRTIERKGHGRKDVC